MARQRVQVQGIQAPTEVRPTARTVETYVKPVAPQFKPSPLAQFVEGISPAIETISQIEKEKQVKRQIEIEQGEKKRKAAEAKLVLKRATRAAKAAGNEALGLDPDKYYGEGGEEALTEVRSAAVADIFAEVEDEEILEAVKSDFKLANITWFEQNFDPEKNKHLRGKTLGNVFNEVIAIEEDDTMTLAEKEQAIESLFQETVDTYENINFNHVNQFAVGTLQRRTSKFGKGALYNVLDKRDQFNASNFLEAGLALDKDNETYQNEKKPEIVSSAIQQMIALEKATNISAADKQTGIQEIMDNVISQNPFISQADMYSAIANVTQERMFNRTTTPMYEFLKSKPEAMTDPNIASNLDNINRLATSTQEKLDREAEQLAADEAKQKLEEADEFRTRAAITTAVIGFRQGAGISTMVGKEVTLPSGKTYTITKEDAVAEFERQSQVALLEKLELAEQEQAISGDEFSKDAIAQRHLAEDMENFYNKVGVIPTMLADPMNTNITFLTGKPLSGVNDEQTIAKVEELLTSYTAVRAMNGDVKNTDISDNDKYRLQAMDFFVNRLGMDTATALSKVQGKDLFDYNVGNVSVEELTRSGMIFSKSEFADIKNDGHVRDYVKRGAEYLMALDGMTRETALKIMSDEVSKDFVIVEDKNGVKTAIEKLSGDLRTSTTTPENIQEFINAVEDIPEVQDVVSRLLPDGAISLANDYDNPQALTLVINGSDGMSMSLGSIDIASLQGSTMEIIVENVLREVNRQMPTLGLPNTIGSVEEGLVGDTGLTPEQYERKYPFSRKPVNPEEEQIVNDIIDTAEEAVSEVEQSVSRRKGRK